MTTETPKYRVAADSEGVWLHGGTCFVAGAEFVWRGWPASDWIGDVEPLNPTAERILRYAKERREGLRPETPFDQGELFLPFRITFDPDAASATLIDKNRALPRMPRYRALRDAPPWMTDGPQRFGGKTITAGDVIVVCEWPVALMRNPGEFEPENASARAVWTYYVANQKNRFLRPSPWCCGRELVWLPDLPKPPRAKAA